MTISHNWLSTYLPEPIDAEKCAFIMTAIGLEVEGITSLGISENKLRGLVVGEVMECEKHPNADSLKLTTVSVGTADTLRIVCGAPNVAQGQKVVVATIGTELHPLNGEPFRIKKAKIRGEESMGMLCAADEIGLNNNHDGIIVLPADAITGSPVATYLAGDADMILEVGLTPNRTDAMSHYGVARDICAYIAHHENREFQPLFPSNEIKPEGQPEIMVNVEDETACMRYSGLSLEGVTVRESSDWLKKRITSIGLKPINNIVDITNYILHETGQPLHAFDADTIAGKTIIVKTLPDGTPFITLDEKERKLRQEDLMICDAEKPLCIAGVYGGINSGVTTSTKNIFLESACFSPESIRKTSLHHNLRTDAATRFEKGTDISQTMKVLLHAADMILKEAGGNIKGGPTDVYPKPIDQRKISLKWKYLQTLSGKEYSEPAVKKILQALMYEIAEENSRELIVLVPHHKPAIQVAADLVQEIMLIDGLDNIAIPSGIMITPSIEKNKLQQQLRAKAANALTYAGFSEIFTNSLTNSRWYENDEQGSFVKMINSLSNELDTMRPSMLHGGLNVMAYNINRKNADLSLYEFGKTYSVVGKAFSEKMHLSLYVSGSQKQADWKHKEIPADLYYLKGILSNLFDQLGVAAEFRKGEHPDVSQSLSVYSGNQSLGYVGEVAGIQKKKHDIKEKIFYADLVWEMVEQTAKTKVKYKEIPRFPSAQRDLAMIVDKNIAFADIEQATKKAGLSKLASLKLFDVFENEKLGAGKKSMAISYTFINEMQTLTDQDLDAMVQTLIGTYEKELNAEIRKQ